MRLGLRFRAYRAPDAARFAGNGLGFELPAID
jgi:hypothetical protein